MHVLIIMYWLWYVNITNVMISVLLPIQLYYQFSYITNVMISALSTIGWIALLWSLQCKCLFLICQIGTYKLIHNTLCHMWEFFYGWPVKYYKFWVVHYTTYNALETGAQCNRAANAILAILKFSIAISRVLRFYWWHLCPSIYWHLNETVISE